MTGAREVCHGILLQTLILISRRILNPAILITSSTRHMRRTLIGMVASSLMNPP
jgi:hypothetical protein